MSGQAIARATATPEAFPLAVFISQDPVAGYLKVPPFYGALWFGS